MDGGLVVRIGVDTLHDVDFTSGRPSGSVGPEGRPNGTTSRHMD